MKNEEEEDQYKEDIRKKYNKTETEAQRKHNTKVEEKQPSRGMEHIRGRRKRRMKQTTTCQE